MLRQVSLPRCTARLSSMLTTRSYATSPQKPPPRTTPSTPPSSKSSPKPNFKSPSQSPSKSLSTSLPVHKQPHAKYADKSQLSQPKYSSPKKNVSKNIQSSFDTLDTTSTPKQKLPSKTTKAKVQSKPKPTQPQTQSQQPQVQQTPTPEPLREVKEISPQTKLIGNKFLQTGDIVALSNAINTADPLDCLNLFNLVKDKVDTMAGQNVSQFYSNLFERMLSNKATVEDILAVTNTVHEEKKKLLFSDSDYKYFLCKMLQKDQYAVANEFYQLMETGGANCDIETFALMDWVFNYVLAGDQSHPKHLALFKEVIAKGDNFVLKEEDFEVLIDYWEKMEIWVHVIPIIPAMRARGFEPSPETKERLKHLFEDMPEEYVKLFPKQRKLKNKDT